MFIDRRVLLHFDVILLGITLLICSLGLVVLYSAGYDPRSAAFELSWLPLSIHSHSFIKQLVYICVGFLAMGLGLSLPPSFVNRYAYFLYSICLILLVYVDLFGSIVKGSQRWIPLGAVNLQPSEIAKLGLIFALAKYLSKYPPSLGGYRIKELFLPLIILGLPVGLIVTQPDLGTALSVLGIGLSMILFVGVRIRSLLTLLIPIIIAIYPIWNSLHDYQKRRIQVLLNPEIDPKGSGYHINQSKIAVGSGGLFGKGYMQGTQTQLEFLPEHTTDFIFSVLAEEWGFLGSIFVVLLYFLFLYCLLKVVLRSKELFHSLVIFGIITLIFIHTVINIGMVIGLLPVVGLPLPFFSYGGSSILSSMFSLGLVLGFDMRRILFLGK